MILHVLDREHEAKFSYGMVAVAVCQMAGAPSDAAIDDPVVVKMATFAASEIGSEYELVNVLSATKQVVNGMIYRMELMAKRKIQNTKNVKRKCTVIVYEIKHQNYLELEEFHCHFHNKQPRL
ncbi:uncharacterized protein LOC132727926 [Ruditapes philippinarum]|uniref:uncharacterized protein LOC132727926 n=1 Tax=Ruditapes philippinarum TaxID=129788 RepID=UPI00295AA864|nr:uncharacterized protein LOC132727926 [Ruditapes philippinarum]